MNSPCKDCPVRHEACHDHCWKFRAWREHHEAECEWLRKMNTPGKVYRLDGHDHDREMSRKKYFGHNGGADRQK